MHCTHFTRNANIRNDSSRMAGTVELGVCSRVTVCVRRLQDLRRDLTTRMYTEDFKGETFVEVELSVSLLQDSKSAMQRCQLVSACNEGYCSAVLAHGALAYRGGRAPCVSGG